MRKLPYLLLVAFLVFLPGKSARADLFGADVGVLTQILAQAIMQLQQLRDILGSAQENIALIQEINRGINDSLSMLRTLDPNTDPGIYRDWNNSDEALRRLQAIYGVVKDNPDAQVQKDADQSVAEAITFSNDLYRWTGSLDELSEQIKAASHSVSPGGAAKLTAQTLGILIQVMNQNLRAQALTMKVNSLALANQNKRNKDETQNFLDANHALKQAMKTENIQFQAPRF